MVATRKRKYEIAPPPTKATLTLTGVTTLIDQPPIAPIAPTNPFAVSAFKKSRLTDDVNTSGTKRVILTGAGVFVEDIPQIAPLTFGTTAEAFTLSGNKNPAPDSADVSVELSGGPDTGADHEVTEDNRTASNTPNIPSRYTGPPLGHGSYGQSFRDVLLPGHRSSASPNHASTTLSTQVSSRARSLEILPHPSSHLMVLHTTYRLHVFYPDKVSTFEPGEPWILVRYDPHDGKLWGEFCIGSKSGVVRILDSKELFQPDGYGCRSFPGCEWRACDLETGTLHFGRGTIRFNGEDCVKGNLTGLLDGHDADFMSLDFFDCTKPDWSELAAAWDAFATKKAV